MNNNTNQITYRTELDNSRTPEKGISVSTSEHDLKFNKSTKQLEELLKTREIQKNRLDNMSKQKDYFMNGFKIEDLSTKSKIMSDNVENYLQPKVHYSNMPKNKSIFAHNPFIVPGNHCEQEDESLITYSYKNIWDAYWPFLGSSETDPKLNIELDYVTFNGTLIEKWNTSLPTPITSIFPIKDIFNFNLSTSSNKFIFNIRLENIPSTGSPVVIDINPKSTTLPFNLNQFVLVKDPNIIVTTPGSSATNILAVIGYYNSNELYLNQFTQAMDSSYSIKNIFLSTQLFFIHVNQINDNVKLSVSHNTGIGENLFKVYLETDSKVEIKETLLPITITPVSIDDDVSDIVVSMRTIYINGKYFMTYATYINNVASAQQLSNISGYLSDLRQTPIQLATMLLFDPVAPITNLDTIIGTTDHERMLLKLYRDVLKKNP